MKRCRENGLRTVGPLGDYTPADLPFLLQVVHPLDQVIQTLGEGGELLGSLFQCLAAAIPEGPLVTITPPTVDGVDLAEDGEG